MQPQAVVSENVYIHFRNKVSDYPSEKKEQMQTHYRKKMKEAVREKNFNAAAYYGRLIAILNL